MSNAVLDHIDATIMGLCNTVRDAQSIDLDTLKAVSESVRTLSQAYNIRMDALLAREGMDMHIEHHHQLPGEAPLS
jgi:ABC-type transporter Mla MlaB component